MCCKIDRSTYIAAKHSVATSIKALVGRHVTHIWRSSLRDEVEDNPHWWAYLQLMCPSNSKDHFEKKIHIFQYETIKLTEYVDINRCKKVRERMMEIYILLH